MSHTVATFMMLIGTSHQKHYAHSWSAHTLNEILRATNALAAVKFSWPNMSPFKSFVVTKYKGRFTLCKAYE